tara:strand:+ start:100 stop:615 length:516 start_codon:yes stop_codon:yes gene_type:complete
MKAKINDLKYKINGFDPFAYQNLFYEYKLKITDAEINQVFLLTKDVNTKNHKTTYENLNVLNFPILKKLRKQITNILDNHKLLLLNNWAQLYNEGDLHKIHIHEESVYSGIIYINGLKPSSTIFYDSSFKKYEHNFKKNTLIMFPSSIPHEVETLKKNQGRLVISFNTQKK